MLKTILSRTVISTFLAGLTGLALSATVAAGSPNAANGKFFLGFWEGVDPLDGSTVQLSLTDVDGDGVFAFIYRESFFSTCFTPQNTQGRGFMTGTASLVAKAVLEVNAERICINDDNTDEPPVPVSTEITADKQEDVLIVPQAPNPDILLHRTSN